MIVHILILAVSLGEASGAGRWIEFPVGYDYTKGYDEGVGAIHNTFMRGEAKACESLEIYFLVTSQWNNYVAWQISYYSSYSALLDSGHYVDWDYKKVLDCNAFKKFWFKWDAGTFSMGFGLEPGVDTYVSSNLGRDVPVTRIYFATRAQSITGIWRWLVDEPPLFNAPTSDGNEILEIAEDTATYSTVYTLGGSDPENDDISFSTVGTDSDVFAVYNGRLITRLPLDYETKKTYFITLQADDGRNQVKNSLLIRVTNVNDVTPVVTAYKISIPEELAVGTDIGKVFSIQHEEADDALTVYHGGTNYRYFNLDKFTYAMTIARVMDIDSGAVDLTGIYVLAMDAAYNYDYIYLTVDVYDINDNAPSFTSEYYDVVLKEGAAAGTNVITVGASDADVSNGGLTTTLMSENGATSGISFALNNFDLTTATTIDYESLAAVNFEYILALLVVDQPSTGHPLSSTAIVRVRVVPVNEDTPAWVTTPAGVTLSENTTEPKVIVQLQASDSDLGPDGEISYAIVSVNPASGTDLFTVDSYTGKVTVGGRLDYDTTTGGVSSYTITVRASDNGASPKHVDGTVTVTVTGVNDNHPVFDPSHYQVSLSEDSAANTDLVTINVSDKDGDTLTLSINGGGDGHFEMVGNVLRYKSGADYEKKQIYIMMIKVFDGKYDAFVAVEVKVVNVIDEPPSIIMIATGAMSEEQAVGTAVFGGYIVSDPDLGDKMTYAISGTGAAFVEISPSTGELSVVGRVDYETGQTQLDLTLVVVDKAGLSDTKSFTIIVKDINDHAPVFNPAVYEAEVEESSAAGVSLVGLTATDTDTGANAQFYLTVESGDGGAGIFVTSGTDLKTGTTAADYEAAQSYTLVVIAVDKPTQGVPNTGSAIVKVTIKPKNEFAPVWNNAVNGNMEFNGVSVSEGDPLGHVVGTFTANDTDFGVDGTVSYSIVSVTGASGASKPDLFKIEATSGKLLTAGELDVDTGTGGESSYVIVIRASDQGATPRTVDGSLTVTLTNANDNPPFFDKDSYSVSVSEDVAVNTVIITIKTEDYDDGDTLTLSIAGGGDGLFEVDGSQIKNKKPLDYETNTYHVLTLRVNDGVHNTDVALQINVKDASDEPPVITMVASATVSEEQALNTGVYGGYLVTDPDVGDTLTYALSGADSDYLSINSATGELSIAKNINREGGKTQLDLTLTVTDQGSNQVSKSFQIKVQDINDKVPLFNPSEYTAEITENSAAGIALVDLKITDSDTGDNARFNVSVASGDGGAGIFKMSGLQLQTANPPDYEALGSSGFVYTLVITATDKPTYGAPNTGTAIVKVTIKPENEFTPKWTAPNIDGSGNFDGATVSEGDPPGTLIMTFQASDDDLGKDGDITYSLVKSTASSGVIETGKFSVDASTGKLQVAGELDVDAGTNGVSSYTVQIRASDNGATPRSVDGNIVVTLANINDNPPYFDQTDYSASVSEDKPVGTIVLTLNMGDYDADTLTCSVVSGRSDLFECDNGAVKIKSGLDYESSTFHVLIIRATDGVFETDVPVQVNVKDVSDEVPVITMVASASMSEEQAIGTGVYGGYVVTDADAGDVLTYSLSGADSGYLTIDSSTGELSVAQNVNREGSDAKTELKLKLTVKDKVGLTATKDFTITVKDINDLPPMFNPLEYTAEVTENSASDLPVVDLTLTDADEGNNAQFSLKVVSGDGGSGVFKMVGQQVQTDSTSINYESLESSQFVYTLAITATDTPDYGKARTGTAIVRVTVKPQNEFTPVWTQPDSSGSFAKVTISEDSSLGHTVTTFQASDDDLGKDGTISYSIVSVTGDTSGNSHMAKFTIDATTGDLLVAEQLDYDLSSSGEHSYTLVVRASDKGASPRTVDGNIVVALSNVNDNPPMFDQVEFSANVTEDSAVDHVVITFPVQDYDADTVTLSVMRGRDDLFAAENKDLKLKGTLDYETEPSYILFIRATDGTHSAVVTVKVNVVDVIDEKPVITVRGSSSVSEKQTIGTGTFGDYTVTDADDGDTLTYALAGADSEYMNIDSTTGVLTLAKDLDSEGTNAKTTLSLTLIVTDQAGLQAKQDFTTTVKDINDFTPTFKPLVYEAEVTEGTVAATSLKDLTCSDGDSGNNAVFAMRVGSGDESPAKFNMSGQQLQTASGETDFETLESSGYMYTLIIAAEDTPDNGSPNTGSAVVKVTVKPKNDFSPSWMFPTIDGSGNFAGIIIDENTVPGSNVITLSATDEDHGEDGAIVYSIVSVTAASGATANGKFSVDGNRGNVSVAGYLDVDAATGGESSYTIIFQASDKATSPNAIEASLVITLSNVNDNAPSFDKTDYNTSIAEDITVGTVVNNFKLEDHDNDTLTLSIITGPTDLFELVGTEMKVKNDLDYETAKFHVFVIRVTDGDFNTDVPLHIDVTDVIDEPPVITIITGISIAEEMPINTPVCCIYSVSDPDENDVLVYELTGADSSYLNIDSSSGQLSVAKNIDREAGATSLSLTLTVTDKKGLQATKDFTITVEDINDQTPLFAQIDYEVTVAENTGSGVSLLNVTVSDDDIGNNAAFTVSVGSGDDTPAKFSFTGQQLQTASADIDYDALESSGFIYTLLITAEDTPGQGEANTGTALVKVKVTPINEHTPVWTAPDASGAFTALSVDENVPAGHVLTTFQAKDDDKGVDGLVTYTIVSVKAASGASTTSTFSLGRTSGVLTVASNLDHDADTSGEESYDITVRASDSGTTPKTIDGTITVKVNNINDNIPFFHDAKYQADVSENAAVGTAVVAVNMGDKDGEVPTLSILKGRSDLFEIDGSSVKLKSLLDFETSSYHLLVLKANDSKYEAEVSLQVDVIDVNDETPVITMVKSSSVSEEQPVGTAVYGGFSVTDADAGDELTYTLSGADSGFLSINSTTGELTVAQNIDRDGGQTQLSLTLTVKDKLAHQAVKDFTITVIDINDQTPTFVPYVYEIEVTENTPADTFLMDFTCTDKDEGNNAAFDLTIDSGDDVINKFKISGQRLLTNNSIDFDTLQSYILVVLATDKPDEGDAKTGLAVVKVTVKPVNEFVPVWTLPDTTGNFAVTTDEDARVGYVLVTVEATDEDRGNDGLVTYSIVSVKGDTTGASLQDMFAVDASTGQFMVTGDLDRDLSTGGEVSYTVNIRASDNGASPNTLDGTIVVTPNNINDNYCSFVKSEYQTSVSEDSAVGTVVITLDTQDPDGDSMSLVIFDGGDDLFEVDGNDIKTKDVLDYETKNSFVLLVNVTDGKFIQTVSVHINVTDVNDEPPKIVSLYVNSMGEGQTIGTGLDIGFDVTDTDKEDSHTFSISGTDSPLVNIDSNTGELSVASHVDRDGTYGKIELTDLVVTVRDKKGNKASKSFRLTVSDTNDLPPTFNPDVYTAEVTENTAAGTQLLQLTCSDGDSGTNALFNTSIVSGDDDTNTKFTTTNAVLFTDANAVDYESLQADGYSYILVIKAEDRPDHEDPRTGTAVVMVKVLPENEFVPVWAAPSNDGSGKFDGLSVNEDSSLGTNLTTFSATDDDHGDDGVVTYSIVSVTGGTTSSSFLDLFAIDNSTGVLMVAGNLDSDLTTGGVVSYTIGIRASDKGATPKTVDGTIIITLNNINDNRPYFLASEYQVDVSEDTAVRSAVITLSTADADSDTVTLSISSGGGGLFEIDNHDVKIKSGLDFETARYHILVISATDGTFDRKVFLRIDVTDAIDEAPVITMVTNGSMSEGQGIGTAVSAGYKATDPDMQDTLTYSLTGADSNFLTINSSTGALTVAEDVDREGASPKTELALTLTVTDLAGLQATKDFTIKVEDVNDSPPTCNPPVFVTNVTENTAGDVVILNLTCTDDDEGDNAKFDVFINSGDDTDAKFKMQGLQLMTSSNKTNYESLGASDFMYTLTITAVDKPAAGEAKTGTAIVRVLVKPENEFSPEWKDTFPDSSGYLKDVSVNEDAEPGTQITSVTAEDKDLAKDGQVRYEITSIKLDDGSDAGDTFVIGAHSGDLQVKSKLDAEGNIVYYDISIRAVDGGTPAKDVSAAIKVYVKNANDLQPAFSKSKYFVNVTEDTPTGISIFSLTATDPDGDNLTFAVNGDGSDKFTCVGTEVRLLQKLDFETTKFHSLKISAYDGKHTVYVSLIVSVGNVVDVPPTISITGYTLIEEQLENTIIGNIFSVTDSDESDTFQYSLSGDNANLFSIHPTSGILSIKDRVDNDIGTHVLDKVTLTVTGKGGLSSSKDLKFDLKDINDNPPIFSRDIYLAVITEGGSSSVSVMDFTVSDADTGSNAAVQLSIIDGDDDFNPRFSIKDTTLFADATTIDYEAMEDPMYILKVEAVDSPDEGQPMTGITTVMVQVNPKNEFTPQWESHVLDANDNLPTINVTENTPAGTIANYTASDGDKGLDGRIVYKLLKANASDGSAADDRFDIFNVDDSGQLNTIITPDADTLTGGSSKYVLVISAADNGSPSRSVTATVTVEITDQNDQLPKVPTDNSEEKWVLRGALMASGAALAAGALLYGKSIISKLKKPVDPYPNRMERPPSADDVFSPRPPDVLFPR